MSKTKIIITGLATIALIFAGLDVAMATGEAVAEAVAQNDGNAFADVLHGIVNVLPWPWNAVGVAVLSAASAVFAWKLGKKQAGKDKEIKG